MFTTFRQILSTQLRTYSRKTTPVALRSIKGKSKNETVRKLSCALFNIYQMLVCSHKRLWTLVHLEF